ncbi:FAD/NAD(P)-binding domain-containing protein [Mycena epipterygia]|nr:FAD/NAD(P)-binding domain-containing protein [Mycena epipterygia]
MPSAEDSPQPLKVSVVGAGIGGLSAAIALRRSGHLVEVFESSEIKTEIGAGIAVIVNALRVLKQWGVSTENLKGVDYQGIVTFDSESGEGVSRGWLVPGLGENHSLLCHRSDVHEELIRLAVGEGEGPPVQIRLGNRVLECDPEDGTITLKNGEIIRADLVIGADGLHSVIRTNILGRVENAPASGISCFRAVFNASKMEGVPEMDWFTEGISGARCVVVKEGEYRLLFIYPCRNGSLVNFIGLYADPHQDNPGWTSTGTREELLQIYHDHHPKFLAFMALADTILKWQLRVVPILPTWVRGRAALLGDAAHATLPTLGQGAAMAVEEAAALGCLLPLGTRREDVPKRLEAYQTLRKTRGEYVNREALEEGTIPAKKGLYLRSPEVQSYLFQHDAIREAQDYYEKHFSSN